MKAVVKVVLFAAVAGGGYVGYTKLQNAPYGINPAVPLGTFEKLDTYLTDDIGLVKSEASSFPFETFARHHGCSGTRTGRTNTRA